METIPILHLITRLIVGGAQENTLDTAAGLNPARYRVEVLSGSQTGSEGNLMEEARSRGIDLAIQDSLVREVSPVRDLQAISELVRRMRTRRYSLVHTHSSKAGVLGRIAARRAGVPRIVHTVHGWSFHDWMPGAVRQLYIHVERYAAGFTDRMVAVSEKDIHKGLANGIGRPEQYVLIRSGVDLAAFDPDSHDGPAVRAELGIPSDAPVLGNAGRFSRQKNPLDWVRTAGLVAREVPEAWFLLVGDGPLRDAVEDALGREGIRDRTVLTGLRRDIPRLMAAIDLFLLTSLWEGLPRVLPQAMSMGIPVVAYETDGATDAVRQGTTGYLVEPGRFDEAASHCISLLRNPSARKEMGARGRELSRGFGVEGMIADIEEMYESLLNDGLNCDRAC